MYPPFIPDTILLPNKQAVGYLQWWSGPRTCLVPRLIGRIRMRDLSHDAPLSLFDAPPPATYLHAKEFVRWCCSFGPGFRNSPDLTNLRYWAHKNKTKISERDQTEILDAARPLFLRRIEQAIRKSERAEKNQLN
ncbi:MAG: hypothetical protein DMG14_14585 [Acidobacteria bacterium]|nr:MAG: hypothetical protein DMG14_14585 [Acidobacteriota bacterium]